MIISRRKFKEEIYKAVSQKEEEMWKQRRQEDEMRDVWKHIYEMRERLDRLDPPRDRVVPCAPARQSGILKQ